MESSKLQPRFSIPVDDSRPKGSVCFDLWAPKLKRRIKLFYPFHVRLWTLLKSNPRISAYYERPAYWRYDERQQLINFWCRLGRREMCWVITAEGILPDKKLLR